jgi:hypothetical protein
MTVDSPIKAFHDKLLAGTASVADLAVVPVDVPMFTAGREKAKHQRPRGYAPWNPHAATRVLIGQVREILTAYEDYLPLTCRQIFYVLVGNYGYPKDPRAADRLGEHLVRARRARMIDFDAIRDDGVVSFSSRWHDGPEDFWDDTAHRIREYRRDRQAGQRARVELWCEAAGMAPQLARVADRYSVPVFSGGGFASLTARRLIADRALNHTVPTVLLHVGDFDPSGESIFTSTVEDAAAFVEADRVVNTTTIEPVRVALTAEQVEQYSLDTAPVTTSDTRSKSWKGEICQLEALSPDQLADIVDTAISSHLDLDRVEAQVDAEKSDRHDLLHALPSGDA